MTPDELKSIPKGEFVVMKTGTHPMQTRLRLFLDWGITFGKPYLLPEKAAREVAYATRQELEQAIFRRHHAQMEAEEPPAPPSAPMGGGIAQGQSRRPRREQHTVPANLRTE